jgi:hypothetical protein
LRAKAAEFFGFRPWNRLNRFGCGGVFAGVETEGMTFDSTFDFLRVSPNWSANSWLTTEMTPGSSVLVK